MSPESAAGATAHFTAPDVTSSADLTRTGPLVAGIPSEFEVVRNPTNVVFLSIRAPQPDPLEADAMLRKSASYPYAERADPQPTETGVIGDDGA